MYFKAPGFKYINMCNQHNQFLSLQSSLDYVDHNHITFNHDVNNNVMKNFVSNVVILDENKCNQKKINGWIWGWNGPLGPEH